jgi:hypothetical protein
MQQFTRLIQWQAQQLAYKSTLLPKRMFVSYQWRGCDYIRSQYPDLRHSHPLWAIR